MVLHLREDRLYVRPGFWGCLFVLLLCVTSLLATIKSSVYLLVCFYSQPARIITRRKNDDCCAEKCGLLEERKKNEE